MKTGWAGSVHPAQALDAFSTLGSSSAGSSEEDDLLSQRRDSRAAARELAAGIRRAHDQPLAGERQSSRSSPLADTLERCRVGVVRAVSRAAPDGDETSAANVQHQLPRRQLMSSISHCRCMSLENCCNLCRCRGWRGLRLRASLVTVSTSLWPPVLDAQGSRI